ncbi:Multidrug resistance protein YkkD [Planktothrix tepida]|uniref:Multidrug resistance protein YkkD n=2 Tax=Planktothrix TaxID=54304 RepID=A0A1J1LRK3_9CYAN|nr:MULTISPECIES: SMR family transporter [Planktothrix]CAD5937987.1 Multidrug resistance protein YkkD [Planktothrix pseudagardhii]CAD5972461.1 Multidrug resistance protein YkkD [Planktothrix tepida]CUR34476.1 Multidrug resistance protein YkkD [Planktothrix tepida PCC 9214]
MLFNRFNKPGIALGTILAFIGFGVLSVWFLSKAMQTIPLGTAYAVWTGIGALGTIILGILIFKDPVSLGRLFFLSLLVISLIGLKATSS